MTERHQIMDPAEEFDRAAELTDINKKLRLVLNTVKETQEVASAGEAKLTDANIKLLHELLRDLWPKIQELEWLCLQVDYKP